MIASSAGYDDIVISLLESKADPQIVNFTGQSILHYAASKNRLAVCFPIKYIFFFLVSKLIKDVFVDIIYSFYQSF